MTRYAIDALTANVITTMRIRLLGDRVSRSTAWRIDEQLARQVEGIVPIAPFGALLQAR